MPKGPWMTRTGFCTCTQLLSGSAWRMQYARAAKPTAHISREPALHAQQRLRLLLVQLEALGNVSSCILCWRCWLLSWLLSATRPEQQGQKLWGEAHCCASC